MRILRLEAGDDGYAVEFHPYVTVVSGLTDHQRTQITDAFQAAISGRTTSLGGLIEVHGVVLDLDAASLSMLELDDVDVDAVVDAGDLPGAASSGLDRQLRAAERRLESLELPYREQSRAVETAASALDAAQATLAAARAEDDAATAESGPDAEAAELEDALARAEQEVVDLAEPGSRAAGELAQAERALADLAELGWSDDDDGADPGDDDARGALEERRRQLRSELDEGAAEVFAVALAELQDLQARLARAEREQAATVAEPVADLDPTPLDDPAAVEVRVEELRGALALHASFDPTEVRAALDAVRLAPSLGELVPSPEALGLADRVEAAERRVDELRSAAGEDPPAPGAVEAAAAELADVRAEIIELERAAAPSTLEADIEELERTHAEVVEARERLEGRLGRGKAQARLDAAVAAEETVLDRLGIRSYTDFMTGGRTTLHAEAEPLELRRLRRREREADDVLRAVQARTRAVVDLADATQDLRALRGRARTLLGDADIADEDLVRALLELREPAAAGTPLDALLDALEGVGLPVRSVELARDDVEAMAADWLDEYHRAEDHKAALEDELARLEGRGQRADLEPDDRVIVPEPPAGTAPEPPDPSRLGPAQEAVREAKERMIAHETAARELDAIEVELEALEGEVARSGHQRAEQESAERRAAEARDALEAIESRRAAAEQQVLEIRAELEQRRGPPARAEEAARRLVAAEEELAGAQRALVVAREGFDGAKAGYDGAVEEVAALRQALADVSDEPAPVEEIEWYLLARLAAQRQVSFAGSVPIVLDRTLDAVDDAGVVHLLERLERMAGAVQVVHLSDDDRVMRWASTVGEERAAVVGPTTAASVAD